jgi:T4 RnlA family RNA ligase
MATKYLNAPENAQLKEELTDLAKMNLSVHMELTSPTLRIVLGYPTERLTILYITDNLDPTAWTPYWNNPGASGIGHILRSHWVNRWSTGAILPNGSINTKEYIDSIKGQVGMEGIVVRYNNGEMTKHKTDWYCALHTTKDSISCPRHLFECIMNEAVDDLKAMLATDELTIARIVEMENMVIPKFNHMIQTVENFYNENKELSRKDYAIKARGIDDGLFGLKMNLYIGTTNNYREYAIKHSEVFVKDEVQLTPDNYE